MEREKAECYISHKNAEKLMMAHIQKFTETRNARHWLFFTNEVSVTKDS